MLNFLKRASGFGVAHPSETCMMNPKDKIKAFESDGTWFSADQATSQVEL